MPLSTCPFFHFCAFFQKSNCFSSCVGALVLTAHLLTKVTNDLHVVKDSGHLSVTASLDLYKDKAGFFLLLDTLTLWR